MMKGFTLHGILLVCRVLASRSLMDDAYFMQNVKMFISYGFGNNEAYLLVPDTYLSPATVFIQESQFPNPDAVLNNPRKYRDSLLKTFCLQKESPNRDLRMPFGTRMFRDIDHRMQNQLFPNIFLDLRGTKVFVLNSHLFTDDIPYSFFRSGLNKELSIFFQERFKFQPKWAVTNPFKFDQGYRLYCSGDVPRQIMTDDVSVFRNEDLKDFKMLIITEGKGKCIGLETAMNYWTQLTLKAMIRSCLSGFEPVIVTPNLVFVKKPSIDYQYPALPMLPFDLVYEYLSMDHMAFFNWRWACRTHYWEYRPGAEILYDEFCARLRNFIGENRAVKYLDYGLSMLLRLTQKAMRDGTVSLEQLDDDDLLTVAMFMRDNSHEKWVKFFTGEETIEIPKHLKLYGDINRQLFPLLLERLKSLIIQKEEKEEAGSKEKLNDVDNAGINLQCCCC